MNCKRIFYFVSAAVTAVLLPSAVALAQDQIPTPKADGKVLVKERVENETLTSAELVATENQLQELLRTAAPERTAGLTLSMLTPHEAAMDALQKNLDVRRSRLTRDIAQQALEEAKALFNPVLFLSVGYGQSERFERLERATVFKRATTRDTSGNNILGNPDPNGDKRNPRAVFDRPRQDQFDEITVPASPRSFTGPTKAMRYQIDLSQQLPWGSSLLLSYRAVDQDTFFINNSAILRANNPPAGFVRSGSYQRPWIASLLTQLSIPLPGSRFFGPYAEQDVGVKLAYLGRERAFWDVQSRINDTLRDVDLAYWELINSLLNLQVVIENRKQVDRLVERTGRFYSSALATNYDRAQVDAELARVQGQEELAWSNYVRRSNELARLLDRSVDHTLLVPSGYSVALANRYPIPPAAHPSATSAGNPGMIAAAVDLNSAQVERERRRVRTRQDVSFNAAVNLLQSNRVFGYSDFGTATGNVFEPDIIEQTYALNFRYPWRNRAVNARLAQAEAGTQKQELVLRSTDNRIQREYHSALAALSSAEARVEITARNVKLAEMAFEKATQQQELRSVTEYQVAEQNKRLLNARLAHIAARTQRKQAEARVLGAMGIFGNVYAQRYAQTDMERHRLKLLAANHALQHFGEQP